MSGKVVRIIAALASEEPPLPFLPIGALMIGGALERQGIDVDFVDLQFLATAADDYVAALAEAVLGGPRVVGISVMSDGLPSVMLACQKAKLVDPDRVIVLGGSGPTYVAVQLMERFDCVDYVVVGEGEETAAELFPILLDGGDLDGCSGIPGVVFREGGKVRQAPARRAIMDVDALAPPAYGCAELERYKRVYFLTSRGCPYHCAFCVTSNLWGHRVRYRSPRGVVSEVKRLLARCSPETTAFGFADDLFTSSPGHVTRICAALQEEGLVLPWACLIRVNDVSADLLGLLSRTGFNRVALGIESGSDRVLRRLEKGFTAADATRAVLSTASSIRDIRLFYIWGFPFEGKDDMMMTVALKWRLEQRVAPGTALAGVWNLASPLAGSRLHAEFDSEIRVDWDLYFRYGGMTRSAFVRQDEAHSGLRDMIGKNKAVFPNFFVFPQSDLEAKMEIIDASRLLEDWRRLPSVL